MYIQDTPLAYKKNQKKNYSDTTNTRKIKFDTRNKKNSKKKRILKNEITQKSSM